jgi:hypothetical protein
MILLMYLTLLLQIFMTQANEKYIDTKLRDLLVENGSIRYNNTDFPKYENFRHFSSTSYIRKLSNGE